MTYSIPYIILLFFLLISATISIQRKDNVLLCHRLNIIGITAFFLFFAFRGYIWHDWMGYYPAFEKMEWEDIFYYDYFKNREPLWFVFNLTVKTFTNSYQAMVIIVSALQTWLLVRFFKKYSVNILLSLAIFLAYSGFELSINLMRNFTATCIFLNAIPFIETRKPLHYLGLCSIASLIHLSAIFYIPCYFILNRRINKWIFISLIMFAYFMLFSGTPFLLKLVALLNLGGEIVESKIEVYSEYGMFGINRIDIIIKLFICILTFLYYEKIIKTNESNRLFINSLLLFILGSFLTSEFTEMSNRIGKLFVFSIWIVCGLMIRIFYYRNNRILYSAFLSLVLVYNVYYSTAERLKEYQNFLLGNADSYNNRLANFNKYFEEPKQIQQKK